MRKSKRLDITSYCKATVEVIDKDSEKVIDGLLRGMEALGGITSVTPLEYDPDYATGLQYSLYAVRYACTRSELMDDWKAVKAL